MRADSTLKLFVARGRKQASSFSIRENSWSSLKSRVHQAGMHVKITALLFHAYILRVPATLSGTLMAWWPSPPPAALPEGGVLSCRQTTPPSICSDKSPCDWPTIHWAFSSHGNRSPCSLEVIYKIMHINVPVICFAVSLPSSSALADERAHVGNLSDN